MSKPNQKSIGKSKAEPEPSINPAVAWGVSVAKSAVAVTLLGLARQKYQFKQDFLSNHETW